MHPTPKTIFFALSAITVLISTTLLSHQAESTLVKTFTPSPTYDPLVQPPLPTNPTEYELGRYLFWRHCMPCHGDRGQGLTDEFRAVWVEDHQNCWARGCHSGKWPEQDSFPIPTIVPAVINDEQMEHYKTQQDLIDYLKATHPPQDPGFLLDDEYQAIAFFVFAMNNRIPVDTPPTPPVTLTSNLVLPPEKTQPSDHLPVITMGLIFLASLAFFLGLRLIRRTK